MCVVNGRPLTQSVYFAPSPFLFSPRQVFLKNVGYFLRRKEEEARCMQFIEESLERKKKERRRIACIQIPPE